MSSDRGDSAYEEANVASFVKSCIEFNTNVSYHPLPSSAADQPAAAGPRVELLLFPRSARDSVASRHHHISSTVEAALSRVKSAGFTVAEVGADGSSVLLGCVTETASRHNCAARPDAAREHVAKALRHLPSGSGVLDVYYFGPAAAALPIAVAVARAAGSSFTAKSGAAERGYTDSKQRTVRVFLDAHDHAALRATALATMLCARLVDAPTCLLDTVTFTRIVRGWAERLGGESRGTVEVKVLRGEELREAGYGGLYGTGKAAEFPPHLVTVAYRPPEGTAPRSRYAFVGKGIVYDTGGLSIKSTAGMCGMKHDMGGAGAAFGGVVALALLNAPVAATAVLCLADNAVGPRAQRCDDILRLKSGVTVELNNTDAEGRLVLSDGVYHATALLPETPDTVVDLATLTGAQGVATGRLHAAVYANKEQIEAAVVAQGRRSGDLTFPVLYCPELHEAEFASEVADYRNSVSDRSNAQVSCAAHFIEASLAKDFAGSWAHVDLAYPAAVKQRATGFGVPLLTALAASEYFD